MVLVGKARVRFFLLGMGWLVEGVKRRYGSKGNCLEKKGERWEIAKAPCHITRLSYQQPRSKIFSRTEHVY